MGKSFIFFARFLLGTVVALSVCNGLASKLGLRWHQVPNHGYLQVVDSFRRSTTPADVVFFGTSSMRNAVVPAAMMQRLGQQLGHPIQVWNLAMPGATPEIALFYAKHLFPAHPPRLFVLEAAPFLWDADRKDHPDSEVYWRWFVDWKSLLDAPRRMRMRDFPEAIHGLDWGAESLWQASGLCGHDFPLGSHPTAEFGGVYELQELDQIPGKNSVSQQTGQREGRRVGAFATSKAWGEDLHAIAQLCRQQNIQLLLVHQPFYPGLLPLFADNAYQDYLRWMRANAEDLDVPFLNLQTEWQPDPAFYRDFIHYAPRGAAWFSQRFSLEILLPFLANPSTEND